MQISDLWAKKSLHVFSGWKAPKRCVRKLSKALLWPALGILATVVVALVFGQPPTGPEYVKATKLVLDYRPAGSVSHPIHTDLLRGALVALRVQAESGPCASEQGFSALARWGLPNQAPMNLQNVGLVGKCERLPIRLGFSEGIWELEFPPTDGCLELLSVGFLEPIPGLYCNTNPAGTPVAAASFGKPKQIQISFKSGQLVQPFEQRVVTDAARMRLILKDPLRYHKNAYETCMANASAEAVLDSSSWRFLELEAQGEDRALRLKAVSRSDKAVPVFEICTNKECSDLENACRFDIGAVVSAILGKLLSGK